MYSNILMKHAREPVGRAAALAASEWKDYKPDSKDELVSHNTKVIQTEHRNRSCGDMVRLIWIYEQDTARILSIEHHAEGCALCRASASILCDTVSGLEVEKVTGLISMVHQITDIRLEKPSESSLEGISDGVRALQEARDYPTRRRCFALAWEALEGGLKGLKK